MTHATAEEWVTARHARAASRFSGVLGHVHQDCIVRHQLGGTLVKPVLPSCESWKAMLDKYAPGCGSPIRVEGTNGGFMPCGAWLTAHGERKQRFCHHCEPK
jgi:hypothetical protein